MKTPTLRNLVRLTLLCLALLPGAAAHAQGVVARVDHTDLGPLRWQLAAQADSFEAVPCFAMIDLLHARVVHHTELSPGQPLSADRPGVLVGPEMAPADVDALLAKFASVRMDAVSYGVASFAGDREADARKVFDLGKALKVKDIVADPAGAPLTMLDRLAGEYGISVAFVNTAAAAPDALLQSLQGTSPRLGVCLDVAACRRAGRAPLPTLQTLGPRLLEVRLEDGAGPDEDAVLRALKARAFVGIFAVGSQSGADGPARTDAWVTAVNEFSDTLAKVAKG